MASDRLDTDSPPSKVFRFTSHLTLTLVESLGEVKMSRLFSLTVGAALAAVAVMFCLAGLAEAQVKPADPALLQELSLYAGSKSCIECHGKFYQLWSTSRHGLAMQPYTPEFARANLTPQTQRPGHRQVPLPGRHRPPGRLGPGNRPQRQEEKIPHSPRPGRQERLLFPYPFGAGTPPDPAGGL